MNLYRLFFILLFLLFAFIAHTQEDDFEVRNEFQLELELTDDLELNSENGIKVSENASSVRELYSELSLSFDFFKFFQATLAYRYTREHEDMQYYINDHRLASDLEVDYEINRFELEFRTRLQIEYIGYYSSPTGNVPRVQDRNKFTVGYDINDNHFTPYISVETYLGLTAYQGNHYNKIRYTIGTDYKINKRMDMEFYFRFQEEINEAAPLTRYIVGVEYSYELN